MSRSLSLSLIPPGLEWELPTKFTREILPLSHKVQRRPPCFLNFSERSLKVAGSNLSLRLSAIQVNFDLQDLKMANQICLYKINYLF